MSGSEVFESQRIDVSLLAARRLSGVQSAVADRRRRRLPTTLATILVGDNPSSLRYISMKHKQASGLGISSKDLRFAEDTPAHVLQAAVEMLNLDDNISGILVQYPLPRHLDYYDLLNRVDARKDVDGLQRQNLGQLAADVPGGILPCTPAGIVEIVREFRDLVQPRVAVIGRGMTVGRPLSLLLTSKQRGIDATVICLHSRSRLEDLRMAVQWADVVVGAAGVPSLIRADWVGSKSVLIAAGVHYGRSGPCSDFGRGCRDRARAWTPTVGGVGAMTRAWLFHNLLVCAEMQEHERI